MKCHNNLRQISTALMNYETAHNSFPMGWFRQMTDNSNCWQDSAGPMVTLCQYYEKSNLFDAWNANVFMYGPENTTINGCGISTLWCPSDALIIGLRYVYPAGFVTSVPMPIMYSSYAGNLGDIYYFPQDYDPDYMALLSQMNGIFHVVGYPNWVSNPNGLPFNPGHIAPVKLAEITDGMSNTFAFSEHAHSLLSQQPNPFDGAVDFYCWNWWTSGNYGDTTFSTTYPMNPQRTIHNGKDFSNGADNYVISAFEPASRRARISRFVTGPSSSSKKRSILGPRPPADSRSVCPRLTASSSSRPAWFLACTRPYQPALAVRSSAQTHTNHNSV